MDVGEIRKIVENEIPLDRFHYLTFEEWKWGTKYTFRNYEKVILKINGEIYEYNYLVVGLNLRDNSFNYASYDFDLEDDKVNSISFNDINSMEIKVY